MNFDTLQLNHKIARLPGRNIWRVGDRKRFDLEDANASADSLKLYGYKIFGWDIEWRPDSTGRVIDSANQILNKIKRIAERKNSFTPGNIVILCHDPILADTFNTSALSSFIRLVKVEGKFEFEYLSNYPK